MDPTNQAYFDSISRRPSYEQVRADSEATGDQADATRGQYERASMARAEAVDHAGMSPINMFSQTERTRQQNSMSRAQAAFNPGWDKWFQMANPDGKASFGGRGSDVGGFGTSNPAGYTDGQLQNENLNFLTHGRVQGMEGQPVAPRWSQTQNLPASEQRIGDSMSSLKKYIGKR